MKEGPVPPAEICISPGLSTSLLFDRDLAVRETELEGQSRFERTETNIRSLILVPSGKLLQGERLRLTVRFAGGESPQSATFLLVVRPEAERQVDVVRAPRSVEACQAELARKEEELRGCQGSHGPAPQSGLARLLAYRVFGSRPPISERALAPGPAGLPPKAALVAFTLLLHSAGSRRVVEVAFTNKEVSKPWRAAGALFTSASGKTLAPLDIVQPSFSQKRLSVWVEVESPPEGFVEPYSLQLWDEDKARPITLPGLDLR